MPPKRAGSKAPTPAAAPAAAPVAPKAPTPARSQSPTTVLRNKSGLPHLIIPKGNNGEPAYSPSTTYLEAKKEGPRTYVPSSEVTQWMLITTLFTVFVLLASYDIPALNFLDSYLQQLDIPHSNVIGKGSLKKALQLLGSVQISLGALYFFLAIPLESASALVVALIVNLMVLTELSISSLTSWYSLKVASTSLVPYVTELADKVDAGVVILASLILVTLFTVVGIAQRLAFANSMCKDV